MADQRNNHVLYHPLGGSARQYQHSATGEVISRRQYLKLQRGQTVEQYQHARATGEQAVVLPVGDERTLEKVYRVFNRMQQGESLTHAAHAEETTPKTVKRHNKALGLFGKTYKKEYQPGKQPGFAGWFTGGDRPHFPIIATDGEYSASVPFDEKHASIMGEYWNAVNTALEGNESELRRFAGLTVYDLNGNKHRLSPDINLIRTVLLMLSDAEKDAFDQRFYERKVVQRAA